MKNVIFFFAFFLIFIENTFSQLSYNLVAFEDNLNTPKISKNDNNYLLVDRPSPKSVWIGATLAYNIEGGDAAENVVGAARIKLAPVKQFVDDKHFNLWVIGNIAKITSGVSEDASKNLSDVIQSNQGLSIGIAPIYTLNPDNANKNFFRGYSTLNYKVNGFKDVGAEKKSINLSQFRGTLGIEFEGFEIEKGGPFNFSVEYIYSNVDGSLYEEVFGENVSSFSTLEISFIIPLPGMFGFFAAIDYSTGSKPIYQLGLVINTPDNN